MIKHITLHPLRIGCPSLSGSMKGIIMSVKGVQEVVVHYEDHSIDVVFDDIETSIERIIKAVGDEMGLALEVGKQGDSKEGNVADTCPM